jgi:cell division protein FtsW
MPRRTRVGAADRDGRRPRARAPRPGEGGPRPGQGALDRSLLVSVGVLAGLGLVMIYSATAPLTMSAPGTGRTLPPHFARHLLAVAVSLICVMVAIRIPLRFWQRLAVPIWFACLIALAATLVAGVEVGGARRWLPVPGLAGLGGLGLRVQPAEFAKWATLMAVCAMLAGPGWRRSSRSKRPQRSDGKRRLQPVPTALGLALPPLVLLVAQPDFGSAALLALLVGLLLFAAGAPLRQLAALAAVAAVGTALFTARNPYALARWKGFIEPWQRATAEGFHLVQSFVAFGRGGSFGVGLGDGRQKLFYLPEAHTDFILSVVAEELGLAGVLLVLGAFAALVVAGTRVARRARDPFTLLVAFAMTALIALPAAVNAGVVMGVVPTTGFTLPFLSFGGSSLLTCSLALGILLRIAAREAPAHPRRVAGAAPRGLVAS